MISRSRPHWLFKRRIISRLRPPWLCRPLAEVLAIHFTYIKHYLDSQYLLVHIAAHARGIILKRLFSMQRCVASSCPSFSPPPTSRLFRHAHQQNRLSLFLFLAFSFRSALSVVRSSDLFSRVQLHFYTQSTVQDVFASPVTPSLATMAF